MRRLRLPSVRVRITLLTTLVVGAALTAGSWALVQGVRSNIEGPIEASERQQLNTIATQVAAGTSPDKIVLASPPVATFAIVAPDGTVYAPIIQSNSVGSTILDASTIGGSVPADAEGTAQFGPTSTSSTARSASSSDAPQAFKVAASQAGGVFTTSERKQVHRNSAGVTTILDLPTDSGGTAHIRSVRPLAEITAAVNSVQQTMWFAVPIAALLVALLTWFMTGRALAPVAHIRNEVDEISRSTLHRRVPVPNTNDEVARLATTMNSMLERLDGAAAREREFLSDASHELRSPIASLGATLEVALRNSDHADWNDVAQRALQEQQRLGNSVDALVTLSSLSEMQASQLQASQPVDLDDIVLEIAQRPGKVPVSAANVSAARIQGRPDLLERLVRNLVDNAQRHANNRVEVTLGSTDGVVQLLVDDDGNGIAQADRERVFDRFTRLDEGRSRDRGGTGLGLAMVRSIAERHGGTVHCEASPLGGARFVVELPSDYQGIATPPLGRKI